MNWCRCPQNLNLFLTQHKHFLHELSLLFTWNPSLDIHFCSHSDTFSESIHISFKLCSSCYILPWKFSRVQINTFHQSLPQSKTFQTLEITSNFHPQFHLFSVEVNDHTRRIPSINIIPLTVSTWFLWHAFTPPLTRSDQSWQDIWHRIDSCFLSLFAIIYYGPTWMFNSCYGFCSGISFVKYFFVYYSS